MTTSISHAAVTPDEYRAVCRRHPAGVAIITLNSGTGPVGFTATSFASLSADPPLVCFNITHTSSSIAALRGADSLVIHLLGEHQLELAQRFSRSAEHRFADKTSWSLLETGEPVLAGTPAWLRATLQQLIPAGDSTLVIGYVTHTHCERDVDGAPAPLIYHDGAYLRTTRVER
ncbi:flavin reductase family protein [Mycolicibacter senuensis]|uniref:flavin reductase family protein n=1 Tax=Mycolicibacter senuensis TaxID=386913 RepID=UPI000DCB7F4F|nr:flavin reductase family protein [Mycolicibacter senuensis]RAV01579.1 flavin reductase [Mycolicibacter senuensis]